jgi:hypothetical protein
VLDDLQLPQEVRAAGMRYRLFDGTNNVSCRMYHNLKEVHEGLSKNTFAAFGYSLPLSVFTWLWVIFVFWEPVIALWIRRIPDYPPLLSLGLAAISVWPRSSFSPCIISALNSQYTRCSFTLSAS